MPQSQLYLDDSYLFARKALVIERSPADGDNWIAVDDNIFHPQGGGQPSDVGTVDQHRVHPRWLADRGLVVLDLGPEGATYSAGDSVACEVDADHRRLLAALHTAGHLVDAVMSDMGFTLLRNNHFPGESRIEFHDSSSVPGAELADEILVRSRAAIDAGLDVWAVVTDGQRVVHIDGLHTAPCGGTHVTDLGDLAGFHIPSVKSKRGSLRVRYDVTHRDRSD